MFYSKNLVNYQFSFVFFVIGILILRCIFYFWIIEQFRDDHIFILRAFYYTQSRLFGSESKSNIVVILVNLERRLFVKQINPECIYQGRHSASLESVHEGYPHAPCRLGIFRIVCRLPLGAEPSRSIGISLRGSAPINIPLTPSDTTSRQLIICPGRMFLFEQWHLFLATMEANKLLGAQLIIAHIQSIIQTLIPLLKIYENEGILQIRPSLRMPSKQNLLFDPNEETLWNNQLNNFHECLYEFKESTEFIGFPDWDDILLASGAIPFTDQLKHFSIANPHIAAFLPKRYPGQIDNLETLFNKTIISPIEHLFFDSIKFSIWPEDNEFISKIFLRPNLVDSVDLHGAGHIIENFIQEELPENIAFFNIQLTTILPQALLLTSNTLLTLQHHNISSFSSSLLLKRLPKKEKYLNLLNTCLKKKNIEGRVRTQKRSKCFNYAQCKPEIKLEIEDYCLNTDNQWGEIYLPNRQLSAFVLFESRLKVMKLCQI